MQHEAIGFRLGGVRDSSSFVQSLRVMRVVMSSAAVQTGRDLHDDGGDPLASLQEIEAAWQSKTATYAVVAAVRNALQEQLASANKASGSSTITTADAAAAAIFSTVVPAADDTCSECLIIFNVRFAKRVAASLVSALKQYNILSSSNKRLLTLTLDRAYGCVSMAAETREEVERRLLCVLHSALSASAAPWGGACTADTVVELEEQGAALVQPSRGSRPRRLPAVRLRVRLPDGPGEPMGLALHPTLLRLRPIIVADLLKADEEADLLGGGGPVHLAKRMPAVLLPSFEEVHVVSLRLGPTLPTAAAFWALAAGVALPDDLSAVAFVCLAEASRRPKDDNSTSARTNPQLQPLLEAPLCCVMRRGSGLSPASGEVRAGAAAAIAARLTSVMAGLVVMGEVLAVVEPPQALLHEVVEAAAATTATVTDEDEVEGLPQEEARERGGLQLDEGDRHDRDEEEGSRFASGAPARPAAPEMPAEAGGRRATTNRVVFVTATSMLLTAAASSAQAQSPPGEHARTLLVEVPPSPRDGGAAPAGALQRRDLLQHPPPAGPLSAAAPATARVAALAAAKPCEPDEEALRRLLMVGASSPEPRVPIARRTAADLSSAAVGSSTAPVSAFGSRLPPPRIRYTSMMAGGGPPRKPVIARQVRTVGKTVGKVLQQAGRAAVKAGPARKKPATAAAAGRKPASMACFASAAPQLGAAAAAAFLAATGDDTVPAALLSGAPGQQQETAAAAPPTRKRKPPAEVDDEANDVEVRRRAAEGGAALAKLQIVALKAFIRKNKVPGGLSGAKPALLARVAAFLGIQLDKAMPPLLHDQQVVPA